MPNPVKAQAKRRRVVYKPRANVIRLANHTSIAPQALLKNFRKSVNMSQAGEVSDDFQELVSDDDSADDIDSDRKVPDGAHEDSPLVPDLFTSPPPIQDSLETETSVRQVCTVQECLPFLAGLENCGRSLFDYNEFGVPRLDRDRHIRYLHDSFNELPARFVAFDASRPWLLYWALTGLSILGEEVKQYRQRWYIENLIINLISSHGSDGLHRLIRLMHRVISTFSPMQNPEGGFGGGHGQISHIAATYAAVLSLAMVGGAESLELIDRRAMWRWLGELKQRDGGFTVCVGGEEDVRGAYCSMTVLSLLGLPLELPPKAPAKGSAMNSFTDSLPEYLSRCQTFEGGISGAPQTEAHGAYAFCALACLCILGPPHVMISRNLDVPMLISWLSSRQYAPEGGFAGRTNKLVDGCYSHWVGGCWPLLEASLSGQQEAGQPQRGFAGTMYSRQGLIRYILSCCQGKHGGLRDKPSIHVDTYHSCYVLAGLSSAQHYIYYMSGRETSDSSPLESARCWTYSNHIPSLRAKPEEEIFEPDDRVEPIHPIYVIPWAAVEQTEKWVQQRKGF